MRSMRGHTFSRDQIDEAMSLLGMPPLAHAHCPITEEPLPELDGGRFGETALTILADDLREAVALAMQLAALVCDPEEVADLHTRMSFGLDRQGRQRYQFRGYHVQSADASNPAFSPASLDAASIATLIPAPGTEPMVEAAGPSSAA